MPSFVHRSYEAELLDRDDIPFDDIRRNMQELDVINTWLGGHNITLKGLKKLLPLCRSEPISICEIGCGGGDNLRAIEKYLSKKQVSATYTGIDINPHCIDHAKATSALKNAVWITSDYRDVLFIKKPDIIFSSLFCHHFNEQSLKQMLGWMRANAGCGFFINDLHRHPFAYHSIRLLTSVFSKSYLVKNDAPLSVLRGFKRKELHRLMQQAGIVNYSIEWMWAFRWLINVRIGECADVRMASVEHTATNL